MIEFEKKYRIDKRLREAIVERLSDLRAGYVGREFEENIIYSNDHLRSTGSIIRLRSVGEGTILTFKRRVPGLSDVKKQVEYEVHVSNRELMQRILAEIGLRPAVIYEKIRDIWRLDSTEVVLDELPFGDFVEIEGPEAEIALCEQKLGIDPSLATTDTYPGLTARLGVEIDSVMTARFGPENALAEGS